MRVRAPAEGEEGPDHIRQKPDAVHQPGMLAYPKRL